MRQTEFFMWRGKDVDKYHNTVEICFIPNFKHGYFLPESIIIISVVLRLRTQSLLFYQFEIAVMKCSYFILPDDFRGS